ncbi:MAG: hypothetical protein ACF8GE_00445 [Phycisphaerales bacterium JB043]
MSHTVGVHEWAVLASEELQQGARVYELISLTDQPGMVRFELDPGDQMVGISVRLGRFGDEDGERAFLWTLVERLEWLRERD